MTRAWTPRGDGGSCRRLRLWLLATLAATCVLAVPAQAATYLGGVADIRAWATGKPLQVPMTIAADDPSAPWVRPGSRDFRYLEAAAGPAIGPYASDVWTSRGLDGLGAVWWEIATATNGRQLTLRVAGMEGLPFRVRVDGSPSQIRYLPGPGYSTYDITVTFPDSRWRSVVLQIVGGGTEFAGETTPAGGSLARPTFAVGPKTIFLGDSWTSGDRIRAPFQGYVERTAELLGLGNAWASGEGGTGFVASGTPGHVNFAARLQSDVLRYRPATVIVAGGSNDLTVSPATFRRAVRSLFARIRRALPHVRLIAVGPWNNNGTVTARYRQWNTIIRDAVRAQRGAFIDPTGWITGHGDTAHPVHDGGNASRYIGPTSHPTVAGYRYIGTRLAHAIMALPRNAGR